MMMPAPHPSASAHGPYVRTWYSPVLVDDLRAGRDPFRKGAATVKELYLGGPNAPPVGYSVMPEATDTQRSDRLAGCSTRSSTERTKALRSGVASPCVSTAIEAV